MNHGGECRCRGRRGKRKDNLVPAHPLVNLPLFPLEGTAVTVEGDRCEKAAYEDFSFRVVSAYS